MSSSQFNFKSSGYRSTDRRFTQKNTIVRPIGIKTPLREGDDIFEMHNSPIRQIADNFRNLIMTNHGERLGMFDYGANLKSIVFDYSHTDNFEQIVSEVIVETTARYIPSIQIVNIEVGDTDRTQKFNLNDNGMARSKLRIDYVIPKFSSPKMSLELELDVGG
jgi:phage baseplate assembly protein W